VEAGARNAMLIEGTSYLNQEGLREYQLRHTHYPKAFKAWWNMRDWFMKNDNWDADKYVKALHDFNEKYSDEENRLFQQQTVAFLKKYYPSLMHTFVGNSILVHKLPLSKRHKGIQYEDGPNVGHILDYPCWREYGQRGYTIGIIVNFSIFSPEQIFGNVGCSEKHVGQFIKLAKKYYATLQKSILGEFVGQVSVEIDPL
jgi:hypothetical protein